MSDDDATAWVASAREYIEQMTNLAMITQTWRMALDDWPRGREEYWSGVRQGAISELYGPSSFSDVELAKFPMQSVDSVKTYSDDGTETVVNVADTFDVDTYRTPARIALKSGASWPTNLRRTNAIIIDYIVGYGDAAADVPAPLKQSVKMVAAYMYEHRGDGCSAADAYQASGAAALASPYVSVRV